MRLLLRRSIAIIKLHMPNRIARVKSLPSQESSAARAGAFDADAFFSALDAARIAKKKNWKQVAQEAGISASTLTRMAQGKRPDVDSLAALAAWSGLHVDEFVRNKSATTTQEPLAMISTYLRSDKHLSPEAARALDAVIKATYERLRGT